MMNELVSREFEEIRPYHDDEVADAIEQLLADAEFLDFLGKYHSPKLSQYFPAIVRFAAKIMLRRLMKGIDSIAKFQQVISHYAEKIVNETTTAFNFEGIEQLQADKACLFVGNHRDIAGDSMLVNYALWLSGRDTVKIAVGDNLVQREFATALMKLNKSFFIKRSQEGAKRIYAAILESSKYIQHSIEQGDSIWIAQSEGRAKDGIDITAPSIIKMFTLAKRKLPLTETVAALNIVPVSIAYEYDPCDYLKAKELFITSTEGGYEKPSGEDLLSLVKGLGEFKGRVSLRFGQPLQGDFQSAEEVALMIDRQVLDNFQLFYINYWALKKRAELLIDAVDENRFSSVWSALGKNIDFPDVTKFEERYQACPEDWRIHWLEMYANPIVSKYENKSRGLTPL